MCHLCNYYAIHEKDLQRHLQAMHYKDPFYCNSCEFEAIEEHLMKHHVRSSHTQPRIFTSKSKGQNIRNGNSTKIFPEKAASSIRENLEHNDKQLTSQSSSSLTCVTCDETFTEKDHHELHVQFYHCKNTSKN